MAVEIRTDTWAVYTTCGLRSFGGCCIKCRIGEGDGADVVVVERALPDALDEQHDAAQWIRAVDPGR